VGEFYDRHIQGRSEKEKAVALYYAVRDEIRYNPYFIRLDAADLRVSRVIQKGEGHCIDKANVLIALCRKAGIHARLGLAKVRNHMGTAGLEKILRSNVLAPHGYAELLIDGNWVKCTPAFNKQLCEKLGVEPLEFDGINHSLFQEYDREDGGYMEYVEDYGSFSETPLPFVKEILQQEYPHLFDSDGNFVEIRTT
jgi:transglutaminase-like putative cysteine protease